MGRALDILRGKADRLPSATPMATMELAPAAEQRAVTWSGGAASAGAALGMAHLSGGKGREWSVSATAYRCVEAISTNLASVDLTVVIGDEAHDDHEVAQLWNVSQPAAPVSARITRQVAFAQAELRGEAFIYLDRGPTGVGPARGAWPIYDPVDVVLEGSSEDPMAATVRGFLVRQGNKKIPLLPSEVLWLRYPHPLKAWHALAPWAAAVGAAELDTHARAWQLGEFKNGAKPGMVIYLGDMDEAAYNAAVADYKSGVEGAHNAGKSLLVAGPQAASVSKLAMTPEEMSYLASRKANAEEVMLAFGIRPDYFVGQSTYENQRAAKTALWSDLLLAKMDVLGSEIDRQLLPDAGAESAFDVSKVDALQENLDAIYNRIRGIAYTDTVLLDEARAQLGLEPLPGGRGQQTLTEFRERLKLESAIALANSATEAPPLRSAAVQARATLAVRPRVVARRGALTVVRRPAPAAPVLLERKAKPRPKVAQFHATHERIGQRVWARLAKKQERVVLRKLNSMRTSELAGWAEHRAHALDLAPETGGWLDRGITDGLTLSPFSRLSLTDGCGCARMAGDDVFDVGYWREQTDEATEAWLRGVWEGAGAQMADGLGVSFDLFDQKVLDAMDARRLALADQVTETTRRVLDSQLLRITAEEGWSIDDAAEAIRGVFDDLTTWRAETIARTEVVGGYNAASSIAARESGVVNGREWFTAEDERVRSSHQRMHGEKVRGDARYSNGLLHPGDPDGPPGETINCRCVELFDVED